MPLPKGLDLTTMQHRADEAARLLKTLGNPQRLRLLCLLVDGEMSVSQLNEQLPELSQSALSQHLGRLRSDGLVRTRRESQTIWYALEDGPAQRIMATLYEIYCAADPDEALCATPAGARKPKRNARNRSPDDRPST